MNYKKSSKVKWVKLNKIWDTNGVIIPQAIQILEKDYKTIKKMFLLNKKIELYEFTFQSEWELEQMKEEMSDLLIKNLNFEIKGKSKGFESITVCYTYLDCKIEDFPINGCTLNEIALKQIDDLRDDELGYILYAALLKAKNTKYIINYSSIKISRTDRINLLKGKFNNEYIEMTRSFVLDDILE